MGAGDIGRHGQPEPGAAGISPSALVEPDEPLDDLVTYLRRDAGAIVVDVHDHLVVVRAHFDNDPTVGMASGVGDEMVDRPPQRVLIAHQRHGWIGGVDGDRNPATPAGDVMNEVDDVDLPTGEGPFVATGQQQQVIDQALQPAELIEQHVACRRPVAVNVPGSDLQLGPHHGHGGTQFM